MPWMELFFPYMHQTELPSRTVTVKSQDNTVNKLLWQVSKFTAILLLQTKLFQRMMEGLHSLIAAIFKYPVNPVSNHWIMDEKRCQIRFRSKTCASALSGGFPTRGNPNERDDVTLGNPRTRPKYSTPKCVYTRRPHTGKLQPATCIHVARSEWVKLLAEKCILHPCPWQPPFLWGEIVSR